MAALVFLSGCKGNCRALYERLCDCISDSREKEECMRRAQTAESRVTLTREDEQRCGELLKQCDCGTIDTLEGKQACGLARE